MCASVPNRLATPRAPAVRCEGLVVRYGSRTAVDGVDLEVGFGEVVVLLGPNGAGKTSTVEALEGYRVPSAGVVRVLGADPTRAQQALGAKVGVMLQGGGAYPSMTPTGLVRLFASYHRHPRPAAQLLEELGLEHVARTPYRRLSGGERQRVLLALALIGQPSVLFLDEPTTGVDPEGRLAVRHAIRRARDAGTAVLVTTHELAEAEHVADRVVVLVEGKVAAAGTPSELGRQAGTEGIRFDVRAPLDAAAIASALEVAPSTVDQEAPGRFLIRGDASPERIGRLVRFLEREGIALEGLRVGPPTLEDAYLRLVASARAQADDRDEAPARASAGGVASDAEALRHVQAAWDEAQRQVQAEREPRLMLKHRGILHEHPDRPLWSEVDDRAGPGAGHEPPVDAAPLWQRLRAQLAAELSMTLTRGESLLLTLAIPLVLLAFFAKVRVLPTGRGPAVAFLGPGILALAIMSSAFVNLSIATAFERSYGVLKRLGTTPLGRPVLLAAKIAALVVVELLQACCLVGLGVGLGWHPAGSVGAAFGAAVLATAAFAGAGLAIAGRVPAEANLALSNGLWVLLLLSSGMLVPLDRLPGWLAAWARALPAAALATALHRALGGGAGVPGLSWGVLAAWAAGTTILAARTFRWE